MLCTGPLKVSQPYFNVQFTNRLTGFLGGHSVFNFLSLMETMKLDWHIVVIYFGLLT